MNNCTHINFYTLLTIILFSCAGIEGEDIHNIPADKIIHVDNLVESPFQYSSYFEQIDYLPLQASDKSRIGYVHDINLYKDILFVLDITTAKRLFLFNRNGNFINAIGNSGKGKGEFQNMISFSIEPKAEEIYILDQIGKIAVFNFAGNFLREFSISGPKPQLYNNLGIVGNSIFLDIRYPQHALDDHNFLLREVTLDGKFKKDWLDMDLVNKGAGKSKFSNILKCFYASPDGVFYTKEFMDTIYRLEENKVWPIKAVESQFRMTNKDIDLMDSNINFYTQAGNFDKIFSLSNVATGTNFSYFSYKQGPAPFSVVERNGSTTLHQFWIDDVSYPNRSFQVQAPQFFTTTPDGKTLIGFTNGKNIWQKDIALTNQHIGGIDPIITDSFSQKFKNVDNPILILYHLK